MNSADAATMPAVPHSTSGRGRWKPGSRPSGTRSPGAVTLMVRNSLCWGWATVPAPSVLRPRCCAGPERRGNRYQFSMISTDSMVCVVDGVPWALPSVSIAVTVSIPSVTAPNRL